MIKAISRDVWVSEYNVIDGHLQRVLDELDSIDMYSLDPTITERRKYLFFERDRLRDELKKINQKLRS